MKRILLYTTVLALSLLFSGCPYESNVPIDNPSIKIDKKLLGVWKLRNKPETAILVSKQDEFTYKIELSNKKENCLAFITLVDGTSFLNVYKKHSNSDVLKYYICKIEIKSDGMVMISEVSNMISEQFTSPGDLKNFVAANMKNSFFFNSEDYSLINEDQIIELSKDRVKKELELSESRSFNSLIIGILILVVLVAFSLWLYVSNKRKTEKLIFEKKEFSAMLQGQFIERNRIATDLHDRLGSMLSTIKVYFNSLEENIGDLNEENKEQYEKANMLLDEACEEVRKISHDLSSDVLVQSGLLAALNNLKDVVLKSKKVNISLLTFGLDTRLESAVEIALFRIIQEMISNILKHSRATEVTIQLGRYGKNLNIVVEDNGIGFDMNEVKKRDGMGLKNIELRIQNLKGKFVVDTNKGIGTTMIIDIPV